MYRSLLLDIDKRCAEIDSWWMMGNAFRHIFAEGVARAAAPSTFDKLVDAFVVMVAFLGTGILYQSA